MLIVLQLVKNASFSSGNIRGQPRLVGPNDCCSTFATALYLSFSNLRRQKVSLETRSPRSEFCPYISHLKSAVQHLKIFLPKPLHKKPLPLLWDSVTSALVAANKVDSRDSAQFPAYRSMLTELDREMEHHHGNICKDPPRPDYQTRHLESRCGLRPRKG